MLSFLAQEPARSFAMRDLLGSVGGAKGTAQVALRALEKAQLVRREGKGPGVAYRYAADGTVGRAMLRAIEASRRLAEPAESDIPWLADFAAGPGVGVATIHGQRAERETSEDAVKRILLAAEPAEDRGPVRTRPGLITRG
jgi:hypothetical protein